jgi:hypothetical protein
MAKSTNLNLVPQGGTLYTFRLGAPEHQGDDDGDASANAPK